MIVNNPMKINILELNLVHDIKDQIVMIHMKFIIVLIKNLSLLK